MVMDLRRVRQPSFPKEGNENRDSSTRNDVKRQFLARAQSQLLVKHCVRFSAHCDEVESL